MAKKKSTLTFPYHFRRYKKSEGGKAKRGKHPKLIVDEIDDQYGFMGLTESAKRGHHNNFPLSRNPQKGRRRPAYIRDELRYDYKKSFGDILMDYDLTPQDVRAIEKILQKYKKKK